MIHPHHWENPALHAHMPVCVHDRLHASQDSMRVREVLPLHCIALFDSASTTKGALPFRAGASLKVCVCVCVCV